MGYPFSNGRELAVRRAGPAWRDVLVSRRTGRCNLHKSFVQIGSRDLGLRVRSYKEKAPRTGGL